LCWRSEDATGINVETVVQLVNEKGVPFEPATNPLRQIFKAGESMRADDAF